MKLRIEINDVPISVKLDSVSIKRDLSGRTNTANFTLDMKIIPNEDDDSETSLYDDEVSLFDVALYDTATPSVNYDIAELPDQQARVTIYNDLTHDPVFSGFVVTVSRSQIKTNQAEWQVTCAGLESLLDNVVINNQWADLTDREIIQDAFTEYLPDIAVTDDTVASTFTLELFSAKDITARQMLDNLAQVSDAQWFIGADSTLHWFHYGSRLAPFHFNSKNPTFGQ